MSRAKAILLGVGLNAARRFVDPHMPVPAGSSDASTGSPPVISHDRVVAELINNSAANPVVAELAGADTVPVQLFKKEGASGSVFVNESVPVTVCSGTSG
jgi:hypothetical protein